MNYAFLHRGGNSELLLLFLGWSMDEHAVAHLASGGLDVLALWDYTAPDIAFLSKRSDTGKSIWPPGRSACSLRRNCWRDTISISLPQPRSTARSARWTPTSASRRRSSSALPNTGGGAGAKPLLSAGRRRARRTGDVSLPCRTPASQQEELFALERSARESIPPNCFRLAVVGERDRIFPPEAQKAFWESAHTPVLSLDLPHYPFAAFHSFREVTDLGEHR
ncbi:MAG: hypothetical protein L6W00_25315 [Lentisphaeria bacterium]|nr:MAG: hypothetical protein L6W00_25315 [Lentisphaeria bacterium]